MSWDIPFLSPNQWRIVLLVWLLKVISTLGFFSPFLYRCVFHFLFHQTTLLCDCGLMGKFSWIWVFFSTGSIWNDLSQKQFYAFSVAEQKHSKPSENGKLFCHYFRWTTNILLETRAVKRAKLQQFSSVECNLIGFCFVLLTLYWFKEKLVHHTQSLPNHSHHALFSTNPEQNQSQRWIGFHPWHGLHVFASRPDWFISFSRRTNEESICCGRNFWNTFAHRKQLRRPEQTLCQY